MAQSKYVGSGDDLQPIKPQDSLFRDLPLKTKKKKGVTFKKGSTTKNERRERMKSPRANSPDLDVEDFFSATGGMQILDADLESSSDSEESSKSDSESSVHDTTFSEDEQEYFLHWRFYSFCRFERVDYMDQQKCLEWIRIVNKLLPAKDRQTNCRKILDTYGDALGEKQILRVQGFVEYYINMRGANKVRFLTEMQRLGMDEKILHYDRQYLADLSEPIGHGAFGMVYFGVSTSSASCGPGQRVAIKVISMAWRNPDMTKRVVRKLRILRKVSDNDNIITLLDVKMGGRETLKNFNYIHMFSNYMTLDLDRHLKNRDITYTGEQVNSIMRQILQGLQFLHGCHVVHRDLKPQNILLTILETGEVDCKICDFGLARSFDENHSRPHLQFGDSEAADTRNESNKISLQNDVSTHVVTRYWRAPEVSLKVQDRHHITAIDIWAAGCIFAEVLQMMESVSFYKLGDWVGNQGLKIEQIMRRNGRVEIGLQQGYQAASGAQLHWESRDKIGADPNRRELFKGGADTMLSGSEITCNSEDDQLLCIAINLGRPPEKLLKKAHPTLRERLKRFSKNPMIQLEHAFTAPPEAMALLSQMLTWDPHERIDAGTALLEPYFFGDSDLMETLTSHDIARSNLLPPSHDPKFVRSMSNFEDVKLHRDTWKGLVIDEICYHNPHLAKFKNQGSSIVSPH